MEEWKIVPSIHSFIRLLFQRLTISTLKLSTWTPIFTDWFKGKSETENEKKPSFSEKLGF